MKNSKINTGNEYYIREKNENNSMKNSTSRAFIHFPISNLFLIYFNKLSFFSKDCSSRILDFKPKMNSLFSPTPKKVRLKFTMKPQSISTSQQQQQQQQMQRFEETSTFNENDKCFHSCFPNSVKVLPRMAYISCISTVLIQLLLHRPQTCQLRKFFQNENNLISH
jgi:hypothetical protein